MIDLMNPAAFFVCRRKTQKVLEQLVKKYPDLLIPEATYFQAANGKPIIDETADFTPLDKFAERFENGQ